MTDFADIPQIAFARALASSSPTPGGGSAAAVALSQAAGLVIMVSDITLGREKWEGGWQAARTAKAIATPLVEKGFDLAQQDSDSFDAVMESFRLPKQTEEQKSERKRAIQDATLHASLVPLMTAEAGLELLLTMADLAEKGNANAVTDVAVASLLASAACKGALFNVEINANSLGERGEELLARVKEIREVARTESRKVMKTVYDRLES